MAQNNDHKSILQDFGEKDIPKTHDEKLIPIILSKRANSVSSLRIKRKDSFDRLTCRCNSLDKPDLQFSLHDSINNSSDQLHLDTNFINQENFGMKRMKNLEWKKIKKLSGSFKGCSFLVECEGYLMFMKQFRYPYLSELILVLCRTNSLVQHSNIYLAEVYFYTLQEEKKNWRLEIFMEYISGVLDTRLLEIGFFPFGLRQRTKILLQTAKAIFSLHSKNSYHGNLKLSKILLSSENFVYLNPIINSNRFIYEDRKKRLTGKERDCICYMVIGYKVCTGFQMDVEDMLLKKNEGYKLFSESYRAKGQSKELLNYLEQFYVGLDFRELIRDLQQLWKRLA